MDCDDSSCLIEKMNNSRHRKIQRRHFLQFASTALASYGLSQINLTEQATRYGKVIAQSTPRKLALLVGINKYPETKRFLNLRGATIDVLLQKELLIHRFGFNPNDIILLSSDEPDRQPTRANILSAFEEHLIKQARPGDVVVFHFSGHGSRLNDPVPRRGADGKLMHLNSSLVPAKVGETPSMTLWAKPCFCCCRN